ncbi:hypothetical protein [Formosa algae]|uniref:Uncharacterized protein n=1 Tax=Formosa algae TaxID=225843 RepID=A0A9X0YJA0_9FLAO|nr:hypothetical protein [Formosa algae]MBP1838287.1 hypothetical protein [Formosa algae]MDQ0334422.1 hypothetical protein [Formosa algae]OEI80516.1 hypothetical protein AST99_08860 [Formosa algae]
MKKIYFILICTTLTFLSCNTDDCEDYNCFTPPSPFLFELVDKTSGENLFTNVTYSPEDINIINTLNNNAKTEFEFIDEDNYNIIQINSIGWKTETVNLEVKIKDETIFNLYVDSERKNEDCCSFTNYKAVEIQNVEYTQEDQFDIYTILVP